MTAAAAGVVVVAFLGGALSGKLEHARTASATPPPATTTTLGPPSPGAALDAERLAVAAVKTDVIDDLSLDESSRRLDPDLTRRAALVDLPAVVTERHADMALAWAPDVLAARDATNDAAVAAAAADRTVPSFTAASFQLTRWGAVAVDGGTASATCVGHFELVEPAVPPGVVNQPDQTWTVTLRLGPTGRWQLESRAAG